MPKKIENYTGVTRCTHHENNTDIILKGAKKIAERTGQGLGPSIRQSAEEFAVEYHGDRPSYGLGNPVVRRKRVTAWTRQAAATHRGDIKHVGEPLTGDTLCQACAKYCSPQKCRRADAATIKKRREKLRREAEEIERIREAKAKRHRWIMAGRR